MNSNPIISVCAKEAHVYIGVRGTYHINEQQFDFSAWRSAYGEGTVSVLVNRPGEMGADGEPLIYLAAHVDVDGTVATWTFDAVDAAIAGFGACALVYMVGDEKKAETLPFTTVIEKSLGDPGATPEPWTGFLDTVIELAEEVKAASSAAVGAEASASESAQSAAESAAAAKASETSAAESADAAQASAGAAARSESNAADSAEAAESAKDAAETARIDAQAAQSAAAGSASAANQSAVSAASSASNAAGSEASAQSNAEYVAEQVASWSQKADQTVVDGVIANVAFDEQTGVFTFTRVNGTTFTYDTALEKVATNWRYDAAAQSLVLTLADGTTQTIPLSAFITETEFDDSPTVEFSVNNHRVTANVKEKSITDAQLDSELYASLQQNVADAAGSAAAAASSAESAAGNASTATARASEAADSAQAAESAAARAQAAQSGAEQSAATATEKASEASGYAASAKSSAESASASASAAAASAESAQGATASAYPTGGAVSGAIASFETDVAAPVKALSVDIPYTVGGIGGVNILNSPAAALEKDFQKLRAFGQYAYPVGRQVNVGYKGADVPFDVLGYDEACLADAPDKHVVSLLAHNILSYGSIPFNPPQYLYAVTAEAWPDGLPAGTYNVTLNRGAYNGETTQDGTYQFTTTKTIPVGGGIRHTQMGVYRSDGAYTKETLLTGTFVTYAADRVATLESGIATVEGSEGTNLGTTTANNPAYKIGDYINYTQRNGHGAGRWSTSFMRQWLNSDSSPMVWEPKTIWSRPMNTLPAGFLYDLDPELKAVLGKVRVRYALSIADGYGYEDVEDIVTLQTMLDMGFGNNFGIAEGPVDAGGTVKRTTAYTFWQGTTQEERIKYEGATAHYWFLSSSYPPNAYNERVVVASGAPNSYSAYGAYGVVPSLHIILDDSANAPLTVDFGDAGTVYGGTLDVTTGLLTATLDADGNPIAAPQTYQLTPQQVTPLLGQNNIFADAGDVNVTYPRGIDGALAEKQDKLTFDAAPTAGSGNPVTSGGVHDAISVVVDNVYSTMLDGTNTSALFPKWWALTDSSQSRYDRLSRWFTLLAESAKDKTYTLAWYLENYPDTALANQSAMIPMDDLADKQAGALVTDASEDTPDWTEEDQFCWYVRANAESLADGTMDILAIEGIDDAFDVTGELAPVYTFSAALWIREWDDGETFNYKQWKTVSDGENWPYAGDVAPDNTKRDMTWHPTFSGGVDSQNRLTSGAGLPAWTYQSANSGLTAARRRNAYEGLWNDCDTKWLLDMWQLRHFNLENSGILEGCTRYNLQYVLAVAESDVQRVIVTTTQGANFDVGSTVSVGEAGSNTNFDRRQAYMRDIANMVRIHSKEDVEIDGTTYTALNLEIDGTITTTTTCRVSTMPWYSGSTEALPGHKDGSIVSLTSGKTPLRVAGVEALVGAYNVGLDPLYNVTMNDGAADYAVYECRDSEKLAGSITADYTNTGITLTGLASGWKFVREFARTKLGILFPSVFGGGETTRYKSAFCPAPSAGVRCPWWFAYLNTGGYAGLACEDGYLSPSNSGWNSVPRLAGSGKKRGEWTGDV